jgi:magnesium transporter
MDQIHTNVLYSANELATRAAVGGSSEDRPPAYRAVGLSLAVASGVFIGISFVLKKVGLLKANAKYNEEAGEGYGYLKNLYWWGGMTLMIVGEICNFVAYAFVDAILVTPLGALSVVVTTILSAIFLKERLSFVGKVGCFQCIIGSIIIVMNAPEQSAVANIQEMKDYVIHPGFLTYAGVVIVGCTFVAFWAGPRYGKKSMLVYLSICSLIGGLSVVATQGLGSAIVAQAGGKPQFNQWFLYVLLVFVIATLLTEIIYLNKALNLFNAALVTPTYYVYFTSATIVTSAVLFRGFRGTGIQIATMAMGFLTIVAGVVLLQMSKSAKDVPDAAVFKGDLDQIREIGEQEQPESEPKADALRGTAAIIRRMSTPRRRMEEREADRLRAETIAGLEPLRENEVVEWDGLRRRRTVIGDGPGAPVRRRTIHPPLGMSSFPDPEEERPETRDSHSIFSSIRTRARSVLHRDPRDEEAGGMHESKSPVPMTTIDLHSAKEISIQPYGPGSLAEAEEHIYGLPKGLRRQQDKAAGIPGAASPLPQHSSQSLQPPQQARRQFSFTNLWSPRRSATPTESELGSNRPRLTSRASSSEKKALRSATEEERLGLTKGDSNRSLLKHASPPAIRLQSHSPSSSISSCPSDEDDGYFYSSPSRAAPVLSKRLSDEAKMTPVRRPRVMEDSMSRELPPIPDHQASPPRPPLPTYDLMAMSPKRTPPSYTVPPRHWSRSPGQSGPAVPPHGLTSGQGHARIRDRVELVAESDPFQNLSMRHPRSHPYPSQDSPSREASSDWMRYADRRINEDGEDDDDTPKKRFEEQSRREREQRRKRASLR